MKTTLKIFILGLVMVMALCYANPASAESDFAIDTGSGATASARLNFQIVIPRFVYFRVGSSGAGNIDTVTFRPSAEEVAEGTAGISGDLGSGIVSVSLVSNAGSITITENNNSSGSGLENGSGSSISYAQISTATNNAALPAPTLSDGGGNVSNPVAAGNITNIQTDWTYTYNNPTTDPPEAGTYGGVANGGQVIYTAATP